jgi:hypothetical protein
MSTGFRLGEQTIPTSGFARLRPRGHVSSRRHPPAKSAHETLVGPRDCIANAAPPSTTPKERMGVGRRAFPHPSLPRARTGMTTPITNAYGDSCAYLQIGKTCAAGRRIASRNGSPGGTFARVMCRYTIHRPQKCAAIRAISIAYGAYSGTFRPFFDERTHDRTHENPRNRRTNPGIRRTNPRFCKRTRGTSCRTHGPEGRVGAAIRPAGRLWWTGCQRWP